MVAIPDDHAAEPGHNEAVYGQFATAYMEGHQAISFWLKAQANKSNMAEHVAAAAIAEGCLPTYSLL